MMSKRAHVCEECGPMLAGSDDAPKEATAREEQLEAALVMLIDAIDAKDREAIDRALFVGRGLTF